MIALQHRLRHLLVLAVLTFSLDWTAWTYGQVAGLVNFSNRVEGVSIRQNALDDFELVGVTRSVEPFPRNASLKVRFFLPRIDSSEIFVEAVELQDSHHYFMRSSNSYPWKQGEWNVFAPWPTGDVIDKLNLDAANIGVRAWYRGANGSRVYAPVDVYQAGEQLPKRSYRFHYVTGQDLRSIEVSVTDVSGAAVKVPLPTLKCSGDGCIFNFAGSTGRFDLDMSSLAEGEYRVKLVGRVPGTSAATALNVALYHRP